MDGLPKQNPLDPRILGTQTWAVARAVKSCDLRQRPVFAILSGLLLALACMAEHKSAAEHELRHAMAQVEMLTPDGIPEIGQDAIDFAMQYYNFNTPRACEEPVFDQNLWERGLTLQRGFQIADVLIGTAAFDNWPLLASTLSHELEAHCRQPLIAAGLLRYAGIDLTTMLERDAYAIELASADRFRLSREDAEGIANTALDFYPVLSLARPGVALNAQPTP